MTRADWILLVLCVAALPWLYQHYWFSAGPAYQAGLWINGEAAQTLALDQDRSIKVQGHLGESIIEIHDRKVRFADSPCRNQVCVHRGWLGRAGETVACLPNRVSVQILGRDRRFDAVNF